MQRKKYRVKYIWRQGMVYEDFYGTRREAFEEFYRLAYRPPRSGWRVYGKLKHTDPFFMKMFHINSVDHTNPAVMGMIFEIVGEIVE